MSKTRANDFLSNMKVATPEPVAVEAPRPTRARQAPAKPTGQGRGSAKPATGRQGLKHIGGYFDTDTIEKVAVLRARLDLDNSELLKLAIDDLYSKQKAKRAFAD